MAVVLLSRRLQPAPHTLGGLRRLFLLHAVDMERGIEPRPTPSHQVAPPVHAWGLRVMATPTNPSTGGAWTSASLADHLTRGNPEELQLVAARKLEGDVVAYHLQFTSDAAAALYVDLSNGPVAWATWKEVKAATTPPPPPTDMAWTRGALFHTPITPRAARLILQHLAPFPFSNPAHYDVVYHGTHPAAENAIKREGFRLSVGGGKSMMGPAVYFCHFPKATRFAMFDAAMAHTPRPNVEGTVLRVLISRADARVLTVDPTGETGTMCCCTWCCDHFQNDHALRVRRVVDHEGAWKAHGDIMEVPCVPCVTALPEMAVRDGARATVLSAATVRGVMFKRGKGGATNRRNYRAHVVTEGDGHTRNWVRHVMLDALQVGRAFYAKDSHRDTGQEPAPPILPPDVGRRTRWGPRPQT